MLKKNCEKWPLASSRLSVRLPAWYNLAVTGQIFVKIDMQVVFFETLLRTFMFD
jgi:hypothetical protein